jgi:hypothetical protein
MASRSATAQIAALQAQLQACRGTMQAGGPQEVQLLRNLQKRIGSANWNQWQIQRWMYYDYVRYTAAGVTELAFFANPLGTVDPVSTLAKTLEQTNLTKTRTFGQVYFIIQQIRTHVHVLPKQRQNATIIADTTVVLNEYEDLYKVLFNLLNQGVLQIGIGQKAYFDIVQPFRQCPPGFGIHLQEIAIAGTTANGQQNLTWQQSPYQNDVFNVTPQQMVEPEQNVDAKITFDNGLSPVITGVVDAVDARVDIGLILDGYIVRPQQ